MTLSHNDNTINIVLVIIIIIYYYYHHHHHHHHAVNDRRTYNTPKRSNCPRIIPLAHAQETSTRNHYNVDLHKKLGRLAFFLMQAVFLYNFLSRTERSCIPCKFALELP